MLRHQGPSLTPSLGNYVRTDLIAHVMNWPADILEKQVRILSHLQTVENRMKKNHFTVKKRNGKFWTIPHLRRELSDIHMSTPIIQIPYAKTTNFFILCVVIVTINWFCINLAILILSQAQKSSEDAHIIGNLQCTKVSADLKSARSVVRITEITATLQEQKWVLHSCPTYNSAR